MHGDLGGKVTVRRAVALYLEIREARAAARDTRNHLRLHLERLAARFGDTPLGQLTSDDLRAWLAGLTSKRLAGAPLAEGSRRHHYLSANLLLGHAVREGWIDRNPLEAVDAPTWGPVDEVGVLSVAQARRLFAVNRHEPVVARLALEAFGGLRASSAGRLRAEQVGWALGGVDLPASLHKSGRRHFVDGQPANLWRWLGAFAFCDRAWDMSERTFAQEKARAFTRAGVPHPHNALRHSFATYHLAAWRDPGRTAILLQHRRSPEILWRHYTGRAIQADAVAYFTIDPLDDPPE